MATIAVLGTLDSKGEEHAFVAALIARHGHKPLLIDVGTGGPATVQPDITREQVAKLDLYWATLKKTPEDRAKAFAWVGCDSIDLAWDELTSDQADKLIGKLQDQMNKIAEASTSTAARAGSRGKGGVH